MIVLCDTNIFINAKNHHQDTIDELNKIGSSNTVISSITLMELYQGMWNKKELSNMKKSMKFINVNHIDTQISQRAVELIEKYKLSHNLTIPDALIAATSLIHKIQLYTYNLKDFDYIPNIILYNH